MRATVVRCCSRHTLCCWEYRGRRIHRSRNPKTQETSGSNEQTSWSTYCHGCFQAVGDRQHIYGLQRKFTTETYPDIKAPLHQDKWQHLLSVRETDPDLAVHEKAMMQVDDTLLYAGGTGVDLGIFFASFPCEPMKAQEIPIISLYNMFLSCISE